MLYIKLASFLDNVKLYWFWSIVGFSADLGFSIQISFVVGSIQNITCFSLELVVIMLFHGTFVQNVVDTDCRCDQVIEFFVGSSISVQSLLNCVLKSSAEHGHEGLVVLFHVDRVFLELGSILGNRCLLGEVLDKAN